ncbi:MAG: PaaI family thioesterase [Solirubrobacteraceae bacterium]|nr:PaaI family thioesterase [Solirubrobacteraceae bacterium]
MGRPRQVRGGGRSRRGTAARRADRAPRSLRRRSDGSGAVSASRGPAIPPHHSRCFGCGPDNPAGLRMRMWREDDRACAELVLDTRHEGAPGFAHGGAVAAALDDLFGGVLVLLRIPAVTAKLSVDYRAPVLLGRPLLLSGSCIRRDGRKLTMQGMLYDRDRLVAEAQALFVEVAVDHFRQSGKEGMEEWGVDRVEQPG